MSEPMKTARGRVIDVRVTGDVREFVLAVGDAVHTLQLAASVPAPREGDIVMVEASGSVAQALTRLGGVAEGAWEAQGDPLRWRSPSASPSRMSLLWQRQAIFRAVRDYLFEEGFLEVHVPLLVKGTCPDVHMNSITAEGGYLTTSTEYQIKRMVAGGFERLFTLTQNFRGADFGERHNPEFTMLEWARAFVSLDEIEHDAEQLIRRAFRALHPHASTLRYGEQDVELNGGAWERLTVREALALHLGLEVSADFSLDSMNSEARRLGLEVPTSFQEDRHALVSLLVDMVQPKLGQKRPTFLRDWPAFMTSSAALREDAPRVAARSELFIAGLEISDGFPSLTDFALQQDTFSREQHRRHAEGKPAVELDARYLEALRLGLPPGAGMALGMDRLVMALTGQKRIRDVIAFAWDEL
jgi:lysyl-tRNA synthetase class 2